MGERCDVCGRRSLLGLYEPCFHSPEEHARAAVRLIMKRHAPRLCAALAGCLAQIANIEADHGG